MLRFLTFFLLFTRSLFALTTLNVTLSSDNNPGGIGEVGDLRYCLNSMNQNLNVTPDDYAIVFAFPMTIQINGILPIINNSANPVNITIGNPGSILTVTLDGNGTYSGFFIPIGNVTIQNIVFQNFSNKGGNGGDGISGGGGGMGAGGAIYAPQSFLFGSNPSITLLNVAIDNCSAIGGNGGSYIGSASTGDEGGGGGGGFSGNGGSIVTTGSTGGGGGGGFGGNGGDVNFSSADVLGGGGGGGGGIGSRATIGLLTNLGHGGPDQGIGLNGNGYGLAIIAGTGAGGSSGGNNAGGGGGGDANSGSADSGGGGGGSSGTNGLIALGNLPPGGGVTPSGGNGGDGGGGGGAGVVLTFASNSIDGQAGSGGYGGGGGGGAGTGAADPSYTVKGGSGGIGGGGGGGGADSFGFISAEGGNSLGGGGGGGGGPSNGSLSLGGLDFGFLGGGTGGNGSTNFGAGFGGGGGGGGSGLGGAIFVDSSLNFTIQAFAGIPTTFNSTNNTSVAGIHGTGGPGASDGQDGSAVGNSIFLRTGSTLSLVAQDTNDLLTLGSQVAFTDDKVFGLGGTSVQVKGNGTIVYNGTTNYQGNILINNANFKVNGVINQAPVYVCRNIGFSPQRGTLSGSGTLTGDVFVNSGTIFPDVAGTLTLGSLILNPANPSTNTLGSLVQSTIDSTSTPSVVAVNGPASLAGTLQIDLDPNVQPGTYTLLTSSAITGTFDFVTFSGPIPNYTLSYLPIVNPTFVQLNFLGYPPPPPPPSPPSPPPPPPPPGVLAPPSNLLGKQKKNDFGLEYELYNQLKWTPSPSPQVIGYFIYRNEKKIAVVDAKTFSYKDHSRKKGASYIYAVTAFDSIGNESSPVTVTITPKDTK
ncbi:MAG: hypothetical protein BGO10_06670 [Chlamydia sp. 32-24]|nr:MAG: hypothetical protein BGO10_06670 [Chlamydia sp. 32-24]